MQGSLQGVGLGSESMKWNVLFFPFCSGLGISGYSQDPEKAGLSLQHCMESAQEVVPEQQHRETPVYLGATAGMRLLRYCSHKSPSPSLRDRKYQG